MIPAIIVCHGCLGQNFLEALDGIWGNTEKIATVSNDGLSEEELEKMVEGKVLEFDGEALIFTDYFGGSCATACLSLVNMHDGLRLVSGVNLPILLYYLAHRHEMNIEDLVQGVIHRGQNAIRELTPPGL
jgi:mannose/fructose-specific phosphotransferase system component IIA